MLPATLMAVSPSSTRVKDVLQAEHCVRCPWLERNGNGGTDLLGIMSQGIGTFQKTANPGFMKKSMDILLRICIYTYRTIIMESLKQCQSCWLGKSNRHYCIYPFWMSIRYCPRCFTHIISLYSLHILKRLFICISDKENRAHSG